MVTVYEIWVISKYSWKALEYDLYASNRGDAFCSQVLAKDFSNIHLTQNWQFKAKSIVQLWLGETIALDGCST